MKYTCTVKINLPLLETVELWKDENHFKSWQDGFESIEHQSGMPNTAGAKSKIILDGRQRIELIETIVSFNLPKEKTAVYEHIHMTNTQKSSFQALDSHTTQYTSEVEYTKFNGFMIKLMAKLFPGKFKAQSQKWMNQFKAFAENYYQGEL